MKGVSKLKEKKDLFSFLPGLFRRPPVPKQDKLSKAQAKVKERNLKLGIRGSNCPASLFLGKDSACGPTTPRWMRGTQETDAERARKELQRQLEAGRTREWGI
jgi:hypothetical protein